MKKICIFTVLLALLAGAASLLATANEFQWAVRAGGASGEYGHGIAIDADGNSYVIGEFEGTATFGDIS
ncbi:MAG: SBBP repeat-containing protein, partial [Candidatus Cloacimonadaceae bacterium]|nr:SBBP repeat-containing protein [Candidatus Cloacimonadaceae bacterium]